MPARTPAGQLDLQPFGQRRPHAERGGDGDDRIASHQSHRIDEPHQDQQQRQRAEDEARPPRRPRRRPAAARPPPAPCPSACRPRATPASGRRTTSAWPMMASGQRAHQDADPEEGKAGARARAAVRGPCRARPRRRRRRCASQNRPPQSSELRITCFPLRTRAARSASPSWPARSSPAPPSRCSMISLDELAVVGGVDVARHHVVLGHRPRSPASSSIAFLKASCSFCTTAGSMPLGPATPNGESNTKG